MSHPTAQFAHTAIETLRALEHDGQLQSDQHLVRNVYLSWEITDPPLSIRAVSESAHLLTIEAKVPAIPEWFSFNLGLGPGMFNVGDVIGLVVDLDNSTPASIGASILSSDGGKLSWTTLNEPLAVTQTPRIITMLHTIAPDQSIVGIEGFHTLVLDLPRSNFRLSIRGLHYFLVPAERGLRSDLPSLNALAV